MKKLLILVAVLLMVSPVFAQSGGRLFVQPNATFGLGSPATTDNDSSCDIGVTPAATLLLPYFEVDFNSESSSALNTTFTVTNTSAEPQIAHVVVWTDWSFPVLDFNIWLTGYDVQGINMYDIIGLGQIPPTGAEDEDNSPIGDFSESVNGNHTWTTECDSLPGPIPASLLARVQSALTGGDYSSTIGQVGGVHDNAIGYVTVDVVATCTTSLPTDLSAGGVPTYFNSAVLFDNVLIGDYQRIGPDATTGNFAGGNPMVHIRALPEGGEVYSAYPQSTNLPFTFYDRYLVSGYEGIDRRQPLPGVWAARFIESAEGAQQFDTKMQIWREGYNSTSDETEAEKNSEIPVTEIVRFDEHENPYTVSQDICQISPCDETHPTGYVFPETSAHSTTETSYFPPQPDTGDLGGWLYLNLNNPFEEDEGATPDREVSQNWVVVQMSAEGRFAVDFDAAWLGNGCSPNPHEWVSFVGLDQVCNEGDPCGIGPLPNLNPQYPAQAYDPPYNP